jgi:hypothetical protein
MIGHVSYLYFTSVHTLDDNRPYPGITVDSYFGAQTDQAVIDFSIRP